MFICNGYPSTEAAHHDDTVYLLSQSYRFPRIPADDSADALTVDRMTAIWYNFAKHGYGMSWYSLMPWWLSHCRHSIRIDSHRSSEAATYRCGGVLRIDVERLRTVTHYVLSESVNFHGMNSDP
jgi:hypothetical protein